MRTLRKYQVDLLIVAGFLLLPLLLYGNVTLGGRTMLPADNLFQWQPWAETAVAYDVEVPHNSLLSDLILQNYVWRQFVRQAVQDGEIPLWNPHLFAGAPFLAAGQHSTYYPFSIIFLALPLAKAYGWYTLSQLWLAGLFMYLFGRVLGMRRASAAVAGLIYQGCGFMLVSAAVFPMIIGAAVWLPFILACMERVLGYRVAGYTVDRGTAVDKNKRAGSTLPWAALGAAALGTQILAGHIEITYYTLLVMAFYGAWGLSVRAWDQLTRVRNRAGASLSPGISSQHPLLTILKPAVWLLSLVIIGLMLGAIQFIPLYEVASANFREGSATLDEVRGWAFPNRRILTVALPNFFGNPAHHHYVDAFTGETIPFTINVHGQPNPHGAYSSSWGIKNYVEGGIYFGILPLFLVLLGIWSVWRRSINRRAEVSFFVTLSFFSLAFIFGTPLYAILYYGLPGINQLHSPFRWVFPLSLCVAVLAGYGMDYLSASRRWQSLTDWTAFKAAQPAGATTGHVWATDHSLPALIRPLLLWSRPSPVTLLGGLAFWGGLLLLGGLFLSRLFYPDLEALIERIFLGLSLAPDAFPHTRAFYSYEFRQFFILGLMATAVGIVLRVSRCPIYIKGRPLWIFLAAGVIVLDLFAANYGFNAAVDVAVLAHKPAMVQWLEQQKEELNPWRLTSFNPHGDKPFNANAAWMFGFQDVRGYDSIIPKQYTDYMATIEPQNELLFNRVQPIAHWESLNSPLLDLLGVRYIITTESIELPKLRLAWEGEGVRVYENLAAVPRAFTLPQTATAVVDEPLAAMAELDPRQFVIVGREDGRLESTPSPVPGSLARANVTVYSNIQVMVDTAVAEPSWLVLTDSYFPGWRAFARPWGGDEADEKEVTITRVNGNFRGVLLEPGNWSVRFRYSPLTFKLGGLTSFMAAVIIAFAFAVWGWRRYYNPQAELSNTGSIAKNSLAPMALNLFNRGIDFVFAAFYLRFLGPFEAGSYATAIAIAGWFEIVSNFGLNTLIIREVSQDKSRAAHYLLNTTILRLGTSLVAGAPIFIYFWGVSLAGNPLSQEMVAAILLFMMGMIFSGMGQGVAGLFYAFEKAERPAAITTVTTILKVGFGVVALLFGYGFVGLAAVSIIVNLVTLVILTIAAFRAFPLAGSWRVDLRLQIDMIRRSYPLMLNHFFAVIFFQIDIPILQQFRGDETVGWYNSAYKWVNAFNVIPSFFTFALFPVISRQVQSSVVEARRTFRMSIKLMLLAALPLAVVTTFLAPILIQLLGGSAFLPHGAIALQLVIWSIPFGWLNSVTNYVLIALGQERIQTRAFIAGVSFNVITNLIFIPRYGYAAAAVTTILSEILLLAIFNAYLRQRMPDVGWLRLLWRPVLVTAVMVAGIGLGAQIHLAFGVALGLILYPVGLWLLGVFGPEERHILNALLPASLAVRLRLSG